MSGSGSSSPCCCLKGIKGVRSSSCNWSKAANDDDSEGITTSSDNTSFGGKLDQKYTFHKYKWSCWEGQK